MPDEKKETKTKAQPYKIKSSVQRDGYAGLIDGVKVNIAKGQTEIEITNDEVYKQLSIAGVIETDPFNDERLDKILGYKKSEK